MFRKKENITKDIEQEMKYVEEFFGYVDRDMKDAFVLLKKAKAQYKKSKKQTDNKKHAREFERSLEAWDVFLDRFIMIARDNAINSERIKKVSYTLRDEADKTSINKKLKSQINKKDSWVWDW